MRRKDLTPAQERILLHRGTELPFTGKLLRNKMKGTYHCAGCGNLLFRSAAKFESKTGWPSFSDVVPKSVKLKEDKGLFMKRIEVTCAKCGGHLGHVFDDGPEPTGKRYCINSLALEFSEDKTSFEPLKQTNKIRDT
jgi:peptide-methionine (R)-S-oxide reductase